MMVHNNDEPITCPRNPESYDPIPRGNERDVRLAAKYLNNSVIEPISAVEWKSSPMWRLGPRVLQHSMWMFVLDGEGIGWIGDPSNERHVQGHDLLLIPQGIRHDLHPVNDSCFRYINVHFLIQLYSAWDLLHFLNAFGIIRESDSNVFEDSSHKLAREYALKEPGWKQIMHSYILQSISYVFRYHIDLITFHPDSDSHRCLLRLLPALEVINANIDNRNIDVPTLCKRVGVSEVYLRKLFRIAMNIGPNAYIQRQRIKQACLLLQSSNLSLKEIADQCGFSDQYYFHRVFRKLTGATPMSYKRKLGEI